MSQKGIEQLIGMVLADKKFLEDFLKNPAEKVQETGLDLSSEELAQVKGINPAKVRRFSEEFSKEFVDRKQTAM